MVCHCGFIGVSLIANFIRPQYFFKFSLAICNASSVKLHVQVFAHFSNELFLLTYENFF